VTAIEPFLRATCLPQRRETERTEYHGISKNQPNSPMGLLSNLRGNATEIESPRGSEKHQSHDDLKPDEARDSLLCEFLHD
jgi:hypothetical protein